MIDAILKYTWLLVLVYGAFEVKDRFDEEEVKKQAVESKIIALDNNIRSQKKSAKEIEKYKADIEVAKTKIEVIRKEFEEIQKKLPNEINDTENLDLLKSIGDQVRIQDLRLTPSADTDGGYYFSKGYELQGEATFLQFLLFLERVANNEQILNVATLELDRGDKPLRGRFQMIKFTVTIEAYRYNPDHKEDVGVEGQAGEGDPNKGKKS